MITVERTTFEDPVTIRVWDELYESNILVTNTWFQNRIWNTSWWQSYGPSMPHAELLLLRLKEGNQVIAIAPFVLYTRSLGAVVLWRSISFVGSPLSPYTDILTQPVHASSAWEQIIAYVKLHYPHAWFEFNDVLPEHSFYKAGVPEQSVIKKSGETYLHLDFAPTGQPSSLNTEGLSKSLKAWYNNDSYKWMFVRGYDEELSRAMIDFNVETFGNASFFANADSTRFFEEVCNTRRNDVWYAVVTCNAPVSILMGFSAGDVLFHFQSGTSRKTLDTNMRTGLMNMYFLLQYAMDHGYRRVDMLRGTEAHKFQFNPRSIEAEHVAFIPRKAALRYRLAQAMRSIKSFSGHAQ